MYLSANILNSTCAQMRTNKIAILHAADGESRMIYFIFKCLEALPLTDVISEFS
jgi:hypothetical protein